MFFLTNQSFRNEKVLIRLDLNVPLDEDLNVTDITRIKACKDTVDFVINNGGACVLMTHLGRPNGKEKELSLSHILKDVSKCLDRKVQFINDCIGDDVEKRVAQMKRGDILLLENLRFYKEETNGDETFAEKLSRLGDAYVNDAFGTCHRKHASTYTVTKYFHKKKYAGKLLEKELHIINKILENGKKPILSILGGAKVSSKLKILNNLIEQVDKIIIAGGMAFTFIKAKGGEIGDSLYEPALINEAKSILEKAEKLNTEIHLPIDVLAGDKFNNSTKEEVFNITKIPPGWSGMDISSKSITAFENIIMSSNTVFWNGPMGVFEKEKFSNGTSQICKILKKAKDEKKYVIVGGGDSIAALNQFGKAIWVDYISTGGGAMLESLEGKILPGVKALN
tara:strand:- start:191 stop:1375 length:1185 start_codon:yes stop_codon:yes gene_type:complete